MMKNISGEFCRLYVNSESGFCQGLLRLLGPLIIHHREDNYIRC